MPVNLNQFDAAALAIEIQKLPPGRALVSVDGQMVRRHTQVSRFDCNIGRGGFGKEHVNSAEEAAAIMLRCSAQVDHPLSLGGATRYQSADDALHAAARAVPDSTPQRRTKPDPNTPELVAVRSVGSKAGLHAYRVRAGKARDALRKGDVQTAVQQLEAVAEHAGTRGLFEDVERARSAIYLLKQNTNYQAAAAANREELEVRVREGKHYIVRNGREVTDGLTREEAERRRGFMAREMARAENVQAIDNEIDGVPNVVGRAGKAAA